MATDDDIAGSVPEACALPSAVQLDVAVPEARAGILDAPADRAAARTRS